MSAAAEWDDFLIEQKRALGELVAGDPRPYQGLWARTTQVSLLGAFGGTALGWEAVHHRLAAVAAAYQDGVYERFDILAERVFDDFAYTVHLESISFLASSGERPTRERRVTKVYGHDGTAWRILHMHSDPLLTTGFPTPHSRRRTTCVH